MLFSKKGYIGIGLHTQKLQKDTQEMDNRGDPWGGELGEQG